METNKAVKLPYTKLQWQNAVALCADCGGYVSVADLCRATCVNAVDAVVMLANLRREGHAANTNAATARLLEVL